MGNKNNWYIPKFKKHGTRGRMNLPLNEFIRFNMEKVIETAS